MSRKSLALVLLILSQENSVRVGCSDQPLIVYSSHAFLFLLHLMENGRNSRDLSFGAPLFLKRDISHKPF